MQIKSGILHDGGKPVRWAKAHSSGGAISPRYIVCHDTAGALRKFSSVEWFQSDDCETSAHFVVERDGTITQLVATNKKAFHAGVSSWKGVSMLNSCSVGIEIVNPGMLNEKGKADWGQAAEVKEIVKKSTPNHGSGYWLPYTPEQIAAVTAICRAVVEEYPDCNEIVTHWEIAPKRKIDTNPLFPLDDLRKSVFDPTPGEVAAIPPPKPTSVPSIPAQPSMAKEAVRSKTVWALLSVVAAKIADFFVNIADWVSGRIGDVVEIVKSAQGEADGALEPIVSLGKTLQFNVGKIAAGLTVAMLLIAIVRHTNDKAEKKRLAAMLPEPDNEPDKEGQQA